MTWIGFYKPLRHQPSRRKNHIDCVLPPPIGAVKSYRLKDKRHAGLLPAVAGSLGVANSIFLMFVVALLPACSKNVQPVLLKEVGDNSGMARKGGLYFYKPGSILDEYVTLELNVGAERITLRSVAECSWAAAKFEVYAEGRLLMFDRRNGGNDLMRVNFEQIGADVIAAGLITRQQIDADLATLEREDFAIPSPILWSVVGRKPAI